MKRDTNHPHLLPHVGQRMVKTAVSVFLCLLIYRLLGYKGESMSAEAVITAIICTQPFISDSKDFALNRFTGTIIGTVWGMLFLFLLYGIPVLGHNYVVLYALMALGVLASVYTSVAFKVSDASGLSAIVFMCIVVCFPDIEEPFLEAARRFLGVLIGTTAAITVNLTHLPRTKNPDCVFFVRGKDLTPDRFSQIPPYVLFHLNHLYVDGAKICLMLEHAPALFTMQMSNCHLSLPLIVMDGAAIFDANENRYIHVEKLNPNHSAWLQDFLKEKGISYFTYIIRNNRTCIFHEGSLNEQELLVLKKLQRSPYRSYLNGDDFFPDEIVYIKIIDQHEKLLLLKEELEPLLATHEMRLAIRSQASTPGVSGLYVYSQKATPKNAQDLLMQLLRVKYDNDALHAVDIFSKNEGYSERDAAVVLHRLTNAYEPPKFRFLTRLLCK
ncbi:MAG: aromatic acid exporter family protein [Eubacteriales bacterium]|nr:aromatic acid exporter family protein [Eubacteriales bacterium]